MSGIAGFWNLDGRPADPGVLAGMSGAIAHRGPDGETRRLAGAAALAHRHLWVTPEEPGEQQPLVGPSGAMLLMDGRIDTRADLARALGRDRTASDAALVLAAYEAWGEGFAERLTGDFAIAVFDPRRSRLVLARDALGVRPLHYTLQRGVFAFASEIKALLAHPAVPVRPDDDGLADFLMFGARPLDRQERTCFLGISSLVPAHLAIVTAERVHVRRYWDFDTGHRLRLGSYDDYVEAFRERFSEAVRRRSRTTSPVAVSVSGGLDSSSIFCQTEWLRLQGTSPCPAVAGVSYYGPEGTPADERSYLAAIESDYQVTIERIAALPLLGVVAGAEEQLWHIEGPFLDYMWSLSKALYTTVRSRGARVLLSGHWGDQMIFSAAYLIDLARRMAWGQVRRHLTEYDDWFATGETREVRRRFAMDLVRAHVPRAFIPPLKWLRRRLTRPIRTRPWFSDSFLARGLAFANQPANLGDGFHSWHARSIYLEARSKYHVHCMEWNNKVGALHGMDMAFPFLDRDLIAFLMAVPGEMQNRNGVPRAMMRDAMRGVLPAPIVLRKWKGDFSDVVNAGVAQDFAFISKVLTGGSLGVARGYLDRGRLAEEVHKLQGTLEGPDCLGSWELTDLFGLELWLKLFLSERGPAARPEPLSQEVPS